MNENTISENVSELYNFTYRQYGVHCAQQSGSLPDSISGHLNSVYSKFERDQRLDEQGIIDRITKLGNEIQIEKSRINNSKAKLLSSKENKENKQKEIDELEKEKVELHNGVDGIDTPTFVISAFITVMLTLYLFIFYSTSGYSAIYGLKIDNVFLNTDVFDEVASKGGAAIAFIVFFPIIFLGLGFLIHNSIEENKRREENKKPKSYILIATLISITFIADAFIGYKISETNYNNRALLNDIEPWTFSMVFSDINFYLILVLGFVVYVIWGVLLNFVLSHPYLKSESQQIILVREQINRRIEEKLKEKSELTSQIFQYEGDIKNAEDSIEEKERLINRLENGSFPISTNDLKAAVGEFMGGWIEYIKLYYSNNEAEILNNEAMEIQNNWLDLKITTLKNES
jgi:hypothetical protein